MEWPWMLQEQLGTTRPRGTSSKRVQSPTSATPTTFTMNWAYSENGPTDPKTIAGMSTFMGVSKTAKAGKGKGWSKESALQLQTAIQLLRKEGCTCNIPPDGYQPERNSAREEFEKDPEFSYLKEFSYKNIAVEKDNETVCVLRTSSDWLYVQCANETVAAIVEEKFAVHFALGRVRHEETTIPIREDLVVIVRTGTGGDGTEESASPGTLFQLKKGGKVISKCLCSYHNSEMDNSGPTIELIETAEEWRQHGYGGELLAVVEEHFEDIFCAVADSERVKFNVCYVTNREACGWFLGQGFQDWDGMGEELGKYLFE